MIHTLVGRKRNVIFNDKDQWIPVPIPALGVSPEWVHAARRTIAGRLGWQKNETRPWPLRGIVFCECGRRLMTHQRSQRGGRPHSYYMVCPLKRAGGKRTCPLARYLRAEVLEERISGFIRGLIENPEVLREQVKAQAERHMKDEGDTERRISMVYEELAETEKERERYTRLYARGKLSDEEYDRYTVELDQRRARAREEEKRLRSARQHALNLLDLVDDYLADLPWLVDREPVIRDYETVPEERAARYRSVYDALPLYLVCSVFCNALHRCYQPIGW